MNQKIILKLFKKAKNKNKNKMVIIFYDLLIMEYLPKKQILERKKETSKRKTINCARIIYNLFQKTKNCFLFFKKID